MKPTFSITILLIFLTLAMCSCTSEEEKKQDIVKAMTKKLCKDIGSNSGQNISSSESGNQDVNNIIGGMLTLMNIPMEKFCGCFSDIIGQELQAHFSYDELVELKKDKTKQLMVIRKILETRDLKADMINCSDTTARGKINDYQQYQKKLDDKFKNK